MRKIDKKLNLAKANLLTEQRYLASKGLVSENLDEEYYDSLDKPMRGQYIDSNELVGKTLFFHTNRSNRNAKRNGMIGIYGLTSTGGKSSSAENIYTNEVKVADAKFMASDKATAATQETGDRTVHAGVIGRVLPLDGMGSGIPADYNPFDKDGASWFYEKGDKEKKEIISADEVYFLATEGGDWKFLVTNPVYGERRIPTEADRQTSMEFPTEEPELAEDVEFLASPMLNDLVIVKTPTEYILVNRLDNTIEAELGPINAYHSKEHLCTTALRLHSELFESYQNVYHGGGEILGPLSACKKGGLEEETQPNQINGNGVHADLQDKDLVVVYSNDKPNPVVASYRIKTNVNYNVSPGSNKTYWHPGDSRSIEDVDVNLDGTAIKLNDDGEEMGIVKLPNDHYNAIVKEIEKDIQFGFNNHIDTHYYSVEEPNEPDYE